MLGNLISETMTNTVPDHRCLLGLVQTHHLPPHKPFQEIVKAYQSIAQHTIPYISTIWKTYCTISHNSDNAPTPSTSSRNSIRIPRLTIISGNNGTISTTQTINDHQPTAYFRKKRQHKRPQPIHDPSQRQLLMILFWVVNVGREWLVVLLFLNCRLCIPQFNK